MPEQEDVPGVHQMRGQDEKEGKRESEMTEAKGMKIIKLQAENVKRLKAVEIVPDKDGNLVIISGKNGAGKSSVLDSIEYALGGAPKVKKPLRAGTEKGGVILDLGEMTVERTFTAAGSYLHVKSKDGFEIGTPQKMLDKMLGKIAFDPLEFVRMDPDKQVRILKDVTGLDFSMADKEYKDYFENRTILNREKKSLQDRIDRNPLDASVPDNEIRMADLAAEYEAASTLKKFNDNKRAEINNIRGAFKDLSDRKSEIEQEISALQEEIAKAEAGMVELKQKGTALQKEVAALVDPDMKAISDKMANAEAENVKVRAKKERKDLDVQLSRTVNKIQTLEEKMNALDEEKDKAMKAAKMPIPGLKFDEEGISYKDIPFTQLCSSEQLKISLAMSIALNPQVRVMLIRDGSLLDQKSMGVVQAMAEKYDVQVWMEAVDETGKLGIVIEDGQVVSGGTK